MRTILALAAVVATTAAAADAAPGKTFVSKRYNYSVALPAGWTSSPASMPWKGGPPFQDSLQVDLFDAADGRSFAVAARPLPRATTLRGWATGYVGSALPSFCKKARGFRVTILGGRPALAFTAHCEVHDVNVEVTVRRGRGYTFALASPAANSDAADRAVFESARRSFRFVP